ncbi:MAG: hypothetical protein MUE55_06370 [Thermoplasmata archaeon]|nr:hypothetical protein [Thermoplasmata archaeon]
MPLSKKVLEDSVRLGRLRRIKMTLYIVQVVMLVALAFVLVFVIGDATMTPSLYLPLDQFAAVMALLLLVVWFARSSSAKHLMAKNSITRSILLAAVGAIITIVLMVPPVLAVTEDAAERTGTATSAEPYSFWSRDPLALQRVSGLEVTSSDSVEVYLVDEVTYEEHKDSIGDMYFLRLNRDDYQLAGSLSIDVPVMEHTLLYVVVNDLSSPGAAVTLTLVKDTSEMFTGIVALIALAFVIANIAWVGYLIPIERKYSQGSIYK